MSATPTDKTATCRQNAARLACRLRSAARDAGVEISPSYAARLVADGLSFCEPTASRSVTSSASPGSVEAL
jgi:hypothetical protein